MLAVAGLLLLVIILIIVVVATIPGFVLKPVVEVICQSGIPVILTVARSSEEISVYGSYVFC